MNSAVRKSYSRKKASVLQRAGVSMKAGDLQLGGRHPSAAASRSSSNLSGITAGQLAPPGSVLSWRPPLHSLCSSQPKEAATLPLGALVSTSATGIPRGSCPGSELPILMQARLLLFGLMEDKSDTSPNTSIPCPAGPLCRHRKMSRGMVAHACHPSTWETETGALL